jgi:hypothetical protein
LARKRFSNPPNQAVDIEFGVLSLAVVCNVILIADTRIPALFREYHKTRPKTPPAEPAIVEIEDEEESEADIYEISGDEEDIESNSDEAEISIPPFALMPDNSVETPSKYRIFAENALYKSILSFGFTSLMFQALNRYLSGLTLFKFIYRGTPTQTQSIIGMHIFATFGTGSRFYSGFTFAFPVTKKTSKKLAHWIAGHDVENRWSDVKNYSATFVLSLPNTVSAFYVAYYSTTQTLQSLPVIEDYPLAIKSTSGFSTLTSFSNEVLSRSPALRKLFDNWWHKKEDDAIEIQAINASHLPYLTAYSRFIYSAGFVDAIAQSATAAISVIEVSSEFFEIDKYNPYLFGVAMLCWMSVFLVEYTSSTFRGHRDTLRYEIYPWLVNHHYLNPPEIDITPESSSIDSSQENSLNDSLLTEEERMELGFDTHTLGLTEPAVEEIYPQLTTPVSAVVARTSPQMSTRPLAITPAGRTSPSSFTHRLGLFAITPTGSPTQLALETPSKSPKKSPAITAVEREASDESLLMSTLSLT